MLLLLHVSPRALRLRQGPSCPVGLFLPLEELQFSLEETADADGLEIVRGLCALLCCLLLLLRCGLDPMGSCAPQLFLLQHPLRLVANGSRLRTHRGSSPASSSPGRDAPPPRYSPKRRLSLHAAWDIQQGDCVARIHFWLFCIFQMEKVCEHSSLAECEVTPRGSGTEQGPSGRVQGEMETQLPSSLPSSL